MEIKDHSVVVLTAEGAFEEWQVKNNEICVGAQLNKPSTKLSVSDNLLYMIKQHRKVAAFAAGIAVAIGISGIGAWTYYTPAGYINIDINPSIEMTYNMFERIINVRAINSDGKTVIDNTAPIKNKKNKTCN